MVAHPDEEAFQIVLDDADRVLGTHVLTAAWQGDVDLFSFKALLDHLLYQLILGLGQALIEGVAQLVDPLAHFLAPLWGNVLHLVQDLGQFALLADQLDADVVQALLVSSFLDFFQPLLTQVFQSIK